MLSTKEVLELSEQQAKGEDESLGLDEAVHRH